MTIKDRLYTDQGTRIDCVMCDNTRNILELLKRTIDNKMPLCLEHLEKMAFLYTINDLRIQRCAIINKFMGRYWITRFLNWLGWFNREDV